MKNFYTILVKIFKTFAVDQNRVINQLMHKVSNLQLSKTRSKLPNIFRNQSVASITTAQLFTDANNITKEIFDFESPPQLFEFLKKI